MLRNRFGLLSAAGALVVAASASTATPTITTFTLADHPNGNAAPPTYGLRIDGMNGMGTVVFQMVDVELTIIDDSMNSGGISLNISGLVRGGEVVNNAFVDAEDYNLDFNYIQGVEAFNGGVRVLGVDNVNNTGSLTPVGAPNDPESVFTVTDNDNNAFIFAPDGHRLPGDNSTWVGRGWLTVNSNGNDSAGTQDWLFTGAPVPTPAGAVVLAMGGLLAAKRRR